MQCPKCNAEVVSGVTFCPNCGGLIRETTPKGSSPNSPNYGNAPNKKSKIIEHTDRIDGFLLLLAIYLIIIPIHYFVDMLVLKQQVFFEQIFDTLRWGGVMFGEGLINFWRFKQKLEIPEWMIPIFFYTLIGLSIICNVYFFQKRAYFTTLCKILLLVNVCYVFISIMIVTYGEFRVKEIFEVLVNKKVIWKILLNGTCFLYLLRSERVKKTFVHP